LPGALAVATAIAVTTPFRHHVDWMNFVQDDFFYYLKVASNVASGNGSTFNGIVPTNGYHPLWMWALAGMIRIGHGIRFVPIFLGASIWLATMASYFLANSLLKKVNVESVVAASLAVYTAIYAMHVFNYGMEVIFTVPAMLGLILLLQQETWSSGGDKDWIYGVAIGLITTLMVLSRLDTVIFATLIAFGIVLQPALRAKIRLRLLIGVGLGVSPLAAYFLFNRFIFGIWLPVSGMAKQLRLDHGFTSPAWSSLFSKSPLQLLNVVPILVAIAALPWLWKVLRPSERAVYPATLLFAFVYLAILSWLSDWQLWGWYFYMLRPALVVALVLLLRAPWLKRLTESPWMLGVLVLVAIVDIHTVQLPQQQPEIVAAAREIQQFSLTHPGTYAMGDRSGAVGYLLDEPVIQTEGLMMDAPYLELIRKQLPLREVLKRYNVRYYVGSAKKPFTGCFNAKEPAQAGPHSSHLEADFCEAPVARWSFAGVQTMIFDLHPQHP
jgi:hypothetical protein